VREGVQADLFRERDEPSRELRIGRGAAPVNEDRCALMRGLGLLDRVERAAPRLKTGRVEIEGASRATATCNGRSGWQSVVGHCCPFCQNGRSAAECDPSQTAYLAAVWVVDDPPYAVRLDTATTSTGRLGCSVV